MQIEQVGPNKPKFGLVVILTGVALLAAFIVAVVILTMHKKNPTPFTKHPVSQIQRVGLPLLSC